VISDIDAPINVRSGRRPQTGGCFGVPVSGKISAIITVCILCVYTNRKTGNFSSLLSCLINSLWVERLSWVLARINAARDIKKLKNPLLNQEANGIEPRTLGLVRDPINYPDIF